MAYDATRTSLYSTLVTIDGIMRQIDATAHTASTAMLNDISAESVLRTYALIRTLRTRLQDAVAAAPAGLVAFAQEQWGDASDIVADYQAVVTAMDEVLAAVDTLMPQSGGYILVQQISDGVITWRTFTPAQANPIKIKMDVLKDSVVS